VLLMGAALLFILLATFGLAYANGANDNFKGVATLFGSGTTDYRRALWWATGTTLAGSLTAVSIGAALIQTFSGRGLVPEAAVSDPAFLAAVGLGAAGTVLLATRFGFPISTTHALVGALVGAGFATVGPAGINLHGLGSLFLLPLLLSPIMALGLAGLLYPLMHRLRVSSGITRETCLCIGEEIRVIGAGTRRNPAAVALTGTLPFMTVGTDRDCFERYAGSLVGINAQTALDKLHFLSAGAVCFARGLNDTPKIVALLITVQAFHLPFGIGLVGIAIALGGLINARRVAETMSHRITGMNPGQGLTANLVTAGLVLFASRLGMPVSTTHVSCGALFGIGAASGRARWRMIGAILLAWITTLPVAVALAAVAAKTLPL
jgi:PiT family inorganic phosphate transporter